MEEVTARGFFPYPQIYFYYYYFLLIVKNSARFHFPGWDGAGAAGGRRGRQDGGG